MYSGSLLPGSNPYPCTVCLRHPFTDPGAPLNREVMQSQEESPAFVLEDISFYPCSGIYFLWGTEQVP